MLWMPWAAYFWSQSIINNGCSCHKPINLGSVTYTINIWHLVAAVVIVGLFVRWASRKILQPTT